MQERAACALLKARFEAAGYRIEENRTFSEAGVEFEIDGYDAARRVGYEYVTEEAGDGWDVDAAVVEKLNAARRDGDVFVLVVDEKDAPDADSLTARADAFLAELSTRGPDPAPEQKPAKRPAVTKPATKAAKTTTAKKPATKKPAAKKPAAKKPAAKKPTTKPAKKK